MHEAAADIEQEVARLNRVVGDVLDFARPLRLEPAPADLAALAGDAARAALDGARRRRALRSSLLDPATGTVVTRRASGCGPCSST